MTEDDIREQVMAHLAEGFNRALFDRPDGPEYARRFADGRVVFVVSNEGIDIRDRSLGIPADN